MTAIESRIVEAWQMAITDLGIQFSSPFTVMRGGRHIECLGLVHYFGRQAGTIISVLHQPSEDKINPLWLKNDQDFFFSKLSEGYATYDRHLFADTLEDWGYFGPEAERPSWYTGKYYLKTDANMPSTNF